MQNCALPWACTCPRGCTEPGVGPGEPWEGLLCSAPLLGSREQVRLCLFHAKGPSLPVFCLSSEQTQIILPAVVPGVCGSEGSVRAQARRLLLLTAFSLPGAAPHSQRALTPARPRRGCLASHAHPCPCGLGQGIMICEGTSSSSPQ